MPDIFHREYLLRLPLPLAQLYLRAYNAKDARSRHDNMFYLFEVLVKLAAAPAVACYLHEAEHGQPRVPAVDRLLAQLALPSFGQWVGILRETARHFGAGVGGASHPLGHLWDQLSQPRRDLPGVLSLFRRIKNGPDGETARDEACSLLDLLHALVQYRNGVFGHGGPRFEEFYERDLGPLLFPAVNEVLDDAVLELLGPRGTRLIYLGERRVLDDGRCEFGVRDLLGVQGERAAPLLLASEQAAGLAPNRPALLWPGRATPLSLDPLLVYRETGMNPELLFLNRNREGQQVEYLSYTTGRTERDRSTAAVLAALLTRVTARAVSEKQLRALAVQSQAETPSVEPLVEAAASGGRPLGEFDVLSELGRGGMGVVYLVRQRSLGRLVALKTLPADLAGDPTALARFQREIRALARCDHPNIVKVLGNGVLPDGQQYYTMEYVPGCDLEQLWRELAGPHSDAPTRPTGSTLAQAVQSASRKKREQTVAPAADSTAVRAAVVAAAESALPPLPLAPALPDDPASFVRRVAGLMRDAARALQTVHDQGLIHRDVKPGNLMLTADGERVVLMDFGLAKGIDSSAASSQRGGLLGTLRYAAPEQLAAANLTVGPPADVRGLGATFWELLTRRRLFGEAEDEKQLAALVHDTDVPRLRVADPAFDRDLEAIVARATERRTADRIPSAGRLAEYLQLYLDGMPLPIRPPGLRERAWRWARRRKALVGVVAACLVALIGLLLWADAESRWKRDMRKADREAKQEADRHRAELKLTAERSEEAGLAELKNDRFASAENQFALAVRGVSEDPELEDYRAALQERLARTRLLVGFYQNLDRMELAAARYQDKPAAAACEEGLRLLGIEENAEWWLHLPDADLTKEQQDRLREDVYTQLLMLTVIRVKNHVAELGLPGLQEGIAAGRQVLRRAQSFRTTMIGDYMEYFTQKAAFEKVSLDASRLKAKEHVDFYLSGIMHVWAAKPTQGELSRFAFTIVKTWNLPGIDLQNPLGRAEADLRAAATLLPRHYWTHYWLSHTFTQMQRHGDAELAADVCIALRPKHAPGYFRRAVSIANRAGAAGKATAQAQVLWTRAAHDADRAIALDPREGPYFFVLGQVRQEQGRFADAQEAAERAIALESDDVDYRGLLVDALLAQNKLAEAEALIERADGPGFEDAEAITQLGNIRYAQQQYAEAVGFYQRAIRIRSDNPVHHTNLGAALNNLKRYSEAEVAYGKALALNANHAPTHNSLGNVFDGQGKYVESTKAYEQAVRLSPDNTDYRAKLGGAFYRLQKYAEAEAAYRQVLQREEGHARAINGLGNVYDGQRKYAEAVEYYEKAIRLNPKDAAFHANLGHTLFRLRKYNESEAAHRKALAVDVNHAGAHNGLGNALDAQGKYEEAVTHYEHAIRLVPDNLTFHKNLANTCFRLRKYPEVEAASRKVLALDANYVEAHNDLGNALDGQAKYAEAVAAYENAIRLNPKNPTFHSNLGNTRVRQRKYAEAEAAYREALAVDGNHAGAHNGLGNALDRQGKYAEAVTHYENAIRLAPDTLTFHKNLANTCFRLGKYAEVEAASRKALALDANYVEAHNDLGNALDRQGRYAEAVDSYTNAIRLNPKNPTFHANLGHTLFSLRKYGEAEAAHRKALALDGNHVGALNGLGNALDGQGRYAEAVDSYANAIRLNPKNPMLHSNLGNTFYRQRKYVEAEAAYRRALLQDRDYPEAHNGLGNILYWQGKLSEAVAAHEKARQISPSNAAFHKSLGDDLLLQGKATEAVAAYAKAAELKGDDPDAHLGLGKALTALGRFSEAAAALSRCRALLQAGDTRTTKLELAVQTRDELAARDAELSQYLADESQRCEPPDLAGLARLCGLPGRRRYVTAARLYDAAFTANAQLADKQPEGHRLQAAYAATLATAGQDANARPLPDKVRDRLRARALQWLHEELRVQAGKIDAAQPDAQTARQTLQIWKETTDFTNVRDRAALDALAESERLAWRQFWTNVDAALQRQPAPMPSPKP